MEYQQRMIWELINYSIDLAVYNKQEKRVENIKDKDNSLCEKNAWRMSIILHVPKLSPFKSVFL